MAQKAFDFLTSIADFVKDEVRKNSIGSTPRIAEIDPEYDPRSYPNTLPRVTFDGESTMSEKKYTVASVYHPYPGDRVVMLPVNGSYVIMNCLSPDAKVFSDGLSLSNFDYEELNTGSEDTTSSSFTNLSTFGPQCTLETGSRAIVVVTSRISATNAGTRGVMGYEISGDTSISPGVSRSLRVHGTAAGINDFFRASALNVHDDLTPGTNTFTAKYAKEGTDTARFDARSLFVWPL
jgi:hypothetical protein